MSKNPVQLTRARTLRAGQTRGETLLWRHLAAKRLGSLKFKRQQPIGPYIVDLVCFGRQSIVEVDGGQHAEAGETARDSARTAWPESQGYRVLRFWNNEVLNNIEGVLEAIGGAVGTATLSPALSHRGRGGKRRL